MIEMNSSMFCIINFLFGIMGITIGFVLGYQWRKNGKTTNNRFSKAEGETRR